MKHMTLAAIAAVALAGPALAAAPDCPNGGTVRFGVEPFESAARLVPIFDKIGAALGKALDCDVQVYVATSYNAEIEAMRAGKLEFGEFGPLGYVLAHQVAHAEAVAADAGADGKPTTYTAGIVTWPGSGITTLAEIAGKSFGYSDPASTSGHLFPAYALRKLGIDPDKGVQPVYAGSHTASFEALRNHKVQAGELNSEQISSATRAGVYQPADYIELWRSEPIPNDPITVRADLPPEFKARAIKVLQSFDYTAVLTPDEAKTAGGSKWVPQQDSTYDGIRDLVGTLNIDLAHLE
jgi:phosphonate transport system substrate-binding protein